MIGSEIGCVTQFPWNGTHHCVPFSCLVYMTSATTKVLPPTYIMSSGSALLRAAA